MATPQSPDRTSPNRSKTTSKKRIFPGNRKDMAMPILKKSCSSSFSLQDLEINNFIRHDFSLDITEKFFLHKDISLSESSGKPEMPLKSWMEENFSGSQYEFTDEYTGLQSLTSFIVSHNMRIDVAVLDIDDRSILLLLLEVHSNKYDDTAAHCAIALIFQLRYIRLYDQEFKEVSGFVFPNTKTMERISLITVHWENFLFHIEWECLKLDEARSKIQMVLDKQSEIPNIVKKNTAKDYFMGLSKEDLTLLQKILPPGSSLEQVESAYSILVRDKGYYYKISPNVLEERTLMDLFIKRLFPKSQSFSHLVLPTRIFRINTAIPIFQFEAQPHQPLSRDEAKKCLKYFIQQAVTALEELHKLGYAHRDVRLSKFCFSKHCEAMLIDFDRATAIGSSYFSGIFFYIPPKRENKYYREGLDFKQLGLMIHTIIVPDKEEEILEGKIEPPNLFLVNLISHGNYDKILLDKFCKPYEPIHSLQEVLSERT